MFSCRALLGRSRTVTRLSLVLQSSPSCSCKPPRSYRNMISPNHSFESLHMHVRSKSSHGYHNRKDPLGNLMYMPWHEDELTDLDEIIYKIDQLHPDNLGLPIHGYDYAGAERRIHGSDNNGVEYLGSEQAVLKRKTKTFPRELSVAPDEVDTVLQRAGALLRKQTNANIVLQQTTPDEKSRVIARDPSVGSARYEFCFTDLSQGYNENTRRVFVRERDGTLRTANQEERNRSDQMYFPKKNNMLRLPQLFTSDEALQRTMDAGMHAKILDTICKIRPSNSSEYISVHLAVYENINEAKMFRLLQQTHHFYGFMMWCISEKKIDNVLEVLLDRSRVTEADELAGAVHSMFPELPSAAKAKASNGTTFGIGAHLREYVFASSAVTNARLITEYMEEFKQGSAAHPVAA
eukprot:m.147189 g.147189  ORF g.147189 m.147189 type:complete len:407 (-) comp30519_c11_seq1:104-1324(-)